MNSHRVHAWKRSLRWPSWLPSFPPAHWASVLSHLALSGPVPAHPPLLMLPPSCPPCYLVLECAGQGCVMPSLLTILQLWTQGSRTKKGNDKYLERVPNDLTWCWCRSWGLVNFQQQFHVLKWKHYVIRCGCFLMHRLKIITEGFCYQFYFWLRIFFIFIKSNPPASI